MFIPRQIADRVLDLLKKFPIISLTGPRQSGKTTLLRNILPDYTYVSLENPDLQDFAQKDPKRFLTTYDRYVILDEVQRVPHLFNYLQGKVDDDNITGQYILSGSQDFLLMERITQSLAGRVALFKLFPFTFNELRTAQLLPSTPEQAIFNGFYPRLFQMDIAPDDFYPNYLETYVERDVRQLTVVQDLMQFRLFMRLCAGRIGQPVNYQSLASDAGISPSTAKAWLNILHTSHIVFLLPPYYRNFAKRIRKASKLYFYDTGLVCNLMNITDPADITVHFARGHLFENLIIAEITKQQFHSGGKSLLYYWQDSNHNEIDLLVEKHDGLVIAEIKSSLTINASFFDHLERFRTMVGGQFHLTSFVIYGGTENQERNNATVCGWNAIPTVFTQ
jgi:hypothetical protein